jgi:large subunit ribosomal protein L23
MALFSKKPKEKVKKDSPKSVSPEGPVASIETMGGTSFAHILLQPRITEKASLKAESNNVYVFEVSPRASKSDIRQAVKEIYKVSPEKVSVARIPSKSIVVRGKQGVRSGGKKAYVYLKKGEKIEVI